MFDIVQVSDAVLDACLAQDASSRVSGCSISLPLVVQFACCNFNIL